MRFPHCRPDGCVPSPSRLVIASFVLLICFVSTALAGTSVSGALSGTWTLAGSPYTVVGNAAVASGQTLSLDAGVQVLFAGNFSLTVDGTLITHGTPAQNVVFTTANPAPAPGQWQALIFNNTSTGTLANTRVRYGGNGMTGAVATTYGAAQSLSWDGGGVDYSAGSGVHCAANTASFTNLTFDHNAGDGLWISSSVLTLHALTATVNGGTAFVVPASCASVGTLSGSGNGKNGCYINGTLGGSTARRQFVWAANPAMPYLFDSPSLSSTDTLVVQAGAVLKAWSSSARILVDGRLFVQGTAALPVWVTSIKDDAHGGDSNGDGAATTPAAGDWLGVSMRNASIGQFAYANFAYGGASGWSTVFTDWGTANSVTWNGGGSFNGAAHGVMLGASTLSVRNASFIGNALDGARASVVSPPVLDSLMASNNGQYGLALTNGAGSLGTLSGSGNAFNGIYIAGTLGAGTAGTFTWKANPSFPYLLGASILPAGDTLQLNAGAIVKGASVSTTLLVDGVLRTLGTKTSPVWFTSIADDARGGDSNHDGAATVAAPGDWTGVSIRNAASASMVWTYFAYGGAQGWSTLFTDWGTASLLNWNGGGSRYSLTHGVSVIAATVSLRNLTFLGNTLDGCRLSTQFTPLLDSLVASSNGAYGIALLNGAGALGVLSGVSNRYNGIYIAGSIGQGTAGSYAWTGNPSFAYLFGTLIVPAGDTLVLNAGAVCKGASATAAVYVDGRLTGAGTSAAPVWFTSLRDAAHGGDTNGDAGAAGPRPGDWTGVSIRNTATADLTWTYFAYGGAQGWSNLFTDWGTASWIHWNRGGSSWSLQHGVSVAVASGTFHGLSFEHNTLHGFYAGAQAPVVIDSCLATDNGGAGIALATNPGSIGAGFGGARNGYNGIYVNGIVGGVTPGHTWSWASNPGFPYLINTVDVNAGDTLQIAAGAVIKGYSVSARLTISGRLVTLGSAAPAGDQGVYFTSLKDDTRGGDSNNDGAASSPAPGDWLGVSVRNAASALLQGTWFSYGGASGWANLFDDWGTVNAIVWNGGGSSWSLGTGMTTTCQSFTATNVRFSHNGGHGASLYPLVSASFSACDFVANGGAGLANASTTVLVSAANCWWGHTSGPLDATNGSPDYNPSGTGGWVTDWVAYRPWAMAGPLTNAHPVAATLVTPPEGASVSATPLALAWTAASDPDGDAVAYDILIDTVYPPAGATFASTGVAGTAASVTAPFAWGVRYYWCVTPVDARGARGVPTIGSFFVAGNPVDVAPPLPSVTSLAVASPLPARGGVTFALALPRGARVTARAFDAGGACVATFADGTLPAGTHALQWTPGGQTRTGVYFVRVTLAGTEARTFTRRVVLVR